MCYVWRPSHKDHAGLNSATFHPDDFKKVHKDKKLFSKLLPTRKLKNQFKKPSGVLYRRKKNFFWKNFKYLVWEAPRALFFRTTLNHGLTTAMQYLYVIKKPNKQT